MKYLYLVIALLLLTGCADRQKLIRLKTTSIKIDTSKGIYISIPKDGSYGKNNYQGSGQMLANEIIIAFSKHSINVQSGHMYQSFDEAIQYAKNNNFTYLIYPQILHWEDRATEWSGIPDKVTVKIDIIETKHNKTLDSVTIKGTSGWATLGGDHPQDLLEKPIREFADSLYL